ncbi:hypothetical protein CASFOL_023549 [Castilleja foliolosa]|uniref:Peroxidase n=1 Tax=Castilleja foliolosa TaxID=1961234 RepID=A0ABD3CPA7_9LAMI
MACYKLFVITLAIVFLYSYSGSAQLSHNYYKKSCIRVFEIVNGIVSKAIKHEKRMGASLLRLHFHDCFVNGCDASVLLDGKSGEKFAFPSNNSLRGFEVIDDIKTKLEEKCPGVVSCADILAIAAMQSVVLLGGLSWDTKLGRKDSTKAYTSAANSGALPSPASNLNQLIKIFKANNLTKQDLVALSGGHSIGQTRCGVFKSRIYNETDIDESFATEARKGCPANKGDDKLEALDKSTPNKFDNSYYTAVTNRRTLLHSDQQLLSGGNKEIMAWVRKYSYDNYIFKRDFGISMLKMGDIMPPKGTQGQIRKDCRKVNKKNI